MRLCIANALAMAAPGAGMRPLQPCRASWSRAAARPLLDPCARLPRAIRVGLCKSHVFRAVGRAAWRCQAAASPKRGLVALLGPCARAGRLVSFNREEEVHGKTNRY